MKAFRELDRVLRGEPVVNPQVPVHMPSLVMMNLALAVVYGCCIGSFGLFGRDAPEYRQVLASAVKLPLMFLLTLGVTFPSLYVFNTLLGTQLRFAVLVRVLTCAMAILNRDGGTRPHRGVLFGDHDQLLVHPVVERRGVGRLGFVRGLVLDPASDATYHATIGNRRRGVVARA